MGRDFSLNPGTLRTMNHRLKIWLLVLGGLAVLALGEQAGLGGGAYFSKTLAITSTRVTRQPPAKDLVSTVQVEKPATRWLPFCKFGETVHRRTYQDRTANGSIFEHEVTTRTRLWVIGFCSTARYDELVSETAAKSAAPVLAGLSPRT